jgi:AcrR family transcriptional regulator
LVKPGSKIRRSAAADPVAGGQRRILLAAERLFGERGLNGVSMRQINEAAGMLNNSAIAYHFGTKEALVRCIYEHRLPELDAVRGAMLAKASAKGKLDNVKELLAILMLPLLTAKDESGRHSYASFLRQMLYAHDTIKMRQELMNLSPVSGLTLQLYYDATPHLPKRLAELRIKIASDLFLGLVYERDLEIEDGYIPVLEDGVFIDGAIDLMVSVIMHKPSPGLRAAFEQGG